MLLIVAFVMAVPCILGEIHPHPGNVHDHMKMIPACASMLQKANGSMNIPNCPAEVNQCFNDLREIGPACIKGAVHKASQGEEAHETHKLARDWFEAICTFFEGLTSCMRGEALYGQFATEHATHTHTRTPNIETEIQNYAISDPCWPQSAQKELECFTLAASQCTNFKVCSGAEQPSTNDAILNAWFPINQGHYNDKDEKLLALLKKIAQHDGATTVAV